MTISELENTLQSLLQRHPNLDEAMLTTLLASGGWDEKTIQEALVLFRGMAKLSPSSSPAPVPSTLVSQQVIPPVKQEVVAQKVVVEEVLQASSPNIAPVPIQSVQEKPKEPESLITPPEVPFVSKQISPPDNLPLKPFETTSKVIPLAEYKEVFHNEKEEVATPAPLPVTKEEKDTVKVTVKRSGFDGEDEGLIVLTGFMLLIILLLLTYMYTNGRL